VDRRNFGHRINRQRGSALVISLLVLVVLFLLGMAMVGTALTETTISVNWRNQTAAFYGAEAGLESGFAKLKALLATNANPLDSDIAALDTSAKPALSTPGFSFQTFQVRRVRPTAYGTVMDSGAYKSLKAFTTDYKITSEVTGPKGSRARLTQVIRYMEVPLFQFGVFYGKGVDLEIAPSPVSTLTGWIHANSNLYTMERLDLNYDGRVTTAGKVYRYIKPDGPAKRLGNPEIKDATGAYQRLNFDHDSDGRSGSWTPWTEAQWRQTALDVFKGTVLDKSHGVQEIIPPIPAVFYDPNNPDVSAHKLIEKGTGSDTAEMKAGKMYYKADLRIETDTAGTIRAYYQNGTTATLPGGIVSTKSFYDPREQKTITYTEVNVGNLKNNLSTLFPSTPFNGILWVSRDAADSGVRLVNGGVLPTTGLTVVSEHPVYIQGDYNTGTTTVGGSNPAMEVPAAVMGDAIYVLSNNWGPNGSDTKTGNPDPTGGNRPATCPAPKCGSSPLTTTTVNAAFMTGPAVESQLWSTGCGSNCLNDGFFENIMRILEDWRQGASSPAANNTLKYKGSIVALWHSQQATRALSLPPGYRTPPSRPWSYDTRFDDLTKLPPGTPRFVVYMRNQWTQE
jgi:Tfp pilus assembly protein PilX